MELKKKRKKKCISKGMGTVMFLFLKLIEKNTQEEKHLSLYQYISKEERYEILNHNDISI
jgi:hypothetical protein